jgi:hypothetical protein
VTPVYVVRRLVPSHEPEIVSAWADIYAAKFEAQRWETDTKIPHDFVEGVIIIAPHALLR